MNKKIVIDEESLMAVNSHDIASVIKANRRICGDLTQVDIGTVVEADGLLGYMVYVRYSELLQFRYFGFGSKP